jgi:hypothetical protein
LTEAHGHAREWGQKHTLVITVHIARYILTGNVFHM